MLKGLTFSKVSAFIIATIFIVVFSQKITKVVENNETCVCNYDGFGYYMYLPYFFQHGDLNMNQQWAIELQNNYCGSDIPVYQLHQMPNGNSIDIYHMGLAFVQLPSYFIADLIAGTFGFKQDGFSKPYHIAYLLNALFFILIGILYLRKLLLLFFNDRITGTVILILYTCSNIFPTFKDAYQLTHLYLFALNALMLYHFFNYTQFQQKKNLVFSALFFGITCFVRPTQAIWGIIPLIVLWKNEGWNKKMLVQVAFFPIAALALNILHLLYWKTIGGSWFIMNLHTEEIILTDPNIWNFLVSYKKGWLLYTPIFLLLIPGFIYLFRTNKKLFWAFFSLLFLTIYILSSWECWWYAASYSSRVMVDAYPFIAIVIGFVLLSIQNKTIKKVLFFLFVGACLWLNTIQIIQLDKYYLHIERMSKQHYWYIFGKTNFEHYEDYRLEINRGDLDWINNPKFQKDPAFKISKKSIFSRTKPLELKKRTGTTVSDIQLSKHFSTDETLFDVTFRCYTSDSTVSTQLRFEQAGKYNVYSWNTIEISKGLPQNQWNELHFKFNEAHLRHAADFIQIYTFNEGDAEVKITDLKIDAYSLIRK